MCSYKCFQLLEYVEEGKKPPGYVFEGAKALGFHLRTWTQRKDVSINM